MCIHPICCLLFARATSGCGSAHSDLSPPHHAPLLVTQAAYVTVPKGARLECLRANLEMREGLHAAGHAVLNVLPAFMMCNHGAPLPLHVLPGQAKSRALCS